jgi:hypothetical protein
MVWNSKIKKNKFQKLKTIPTIQNPAKNNPKINPIIINIPTGTLLPFTVTVSICLNYPCILCDNILTKNPETKICTLNYFDAASSLAAMFTCGDR